jgi:hypothetical protein
LTLKLYIASLKVQNRIFLTSLILYDDVAVKMGVEKFKLFGFVLFKNLFILNNIVGRLLALNSKPKIVVLLNVQCCVTE